MDGFFKALWFWLPVLIYKAFAALFRTLWKFNLWILQSISGVQLYYCKPEYRMPGIFLGTIGVMMSANFILFLFIISVSADNEIVTQDFPVLDFLIIGFLGLGLLLACRLLIRRGSI